MIAQGQQGQMGVTAPMAKFPGQQQQMLVLSSARVVAFMLSIFESLKLWVSCLRWCRWCWQAQTNTAMGRRGADLEKLGKFFRELLEFSDPKLIQLLQGFGMQGPMQGQGTMPPQGGGPQACAFTCRWWTDSCSATILFGSNFQLKGHDSWFVSVEVKNYIRYICIYIYIYKGY